MKSFIKIILITFFIPSLSLASPKAIKGEIDLLKWDIETNKKIELNGEWHFFWKKFITPEQIIKKGIPKNGSLIQVPGLWSSLKDKNKSLTLGYGTYILKVKELKTSGKIGFVLPYFATSFRAYIIQGNNVFNLFSSGKVGTTKEASIPKAVKRVTELNLRGEDFYIVFHGSNFHYRSGGFFYSLSMGKANTIKEEANQDNFRSIFVLGITFIISMYHFGLFTLRRKDIGSLWFGIFCLTFFIRELSTESVLMYYVDRSHFWFSLNSKLEYISFFLLPPIQLMFMNEILKDCFNKKIISFYWMVAILYSLYTLFMSSVVFTNINNTLSYQVLVALTNIFYVPFILIRSSIRKIQYARPLLFAILFLFLGVVYDILVNNDIIEPFIAPFITPYTFVAFIFIQSYILATKFSFAFKTAENLSKNLEKEVVIRTMEAVQAKNEALESEKNISNLLNNMRQSVFSVGTDGEIIPPVSEYSQEIFGTDIKAKTIYETLLKDLDSNSEVISQISFVLDICIGADLFQYNVLKDSLPNKIIVPDIEKKEKILKITYSPILDKDEFVEKIMFVIEDVTELKKLEREALEKEEASAIKIQRLQEIVSNDKKDFRVFSRDVNLNLNSGDKSIESSNLDGLFRAVHTIKGTARIYNLTGLSAEVHVFESLIEKFRSDSIVKDESWNDIKKIKLDLNKAVENYLTLGREIFGSDVDETFLATNSNSIEISKSIFLSSLDKLKEIAKNNQDKKIFDIVKMLEFEEFKKSLLGLQEIVNKISLSLNKKITLEVLGDEVYLETKVISMLRDSMMHLVQNSCDHGIKKEGVVKIELKEKENDILLNLTDNGVGLDHFLIRERAVGKGMITKEEVEKLEIEDVLSLIMMPGFSTKEVATEYSGRGVGLDVVKTNIESLGGTIKITSTLGSGTSFDIKIPKS